HREVDEQFVVRHRFRAEDARDPDERNARDEGADDRHRVAGHQSESSREGLARQAEFAAAHGAGDARGPFQSEEGVVVHPAHDEGIALEDAESEDFRAHRDRPVGRRQIRREADVDRQGPRALRDREGVARDDARGHAREGREDRPRGPQEERAEGEARERPRPDHVGRASFVRTSAAARREGTRPAKTAARRATASVRPIASIGRERIRGGRGRRGTWISATPARRKPTAPRVSSRVRPSRWTVDASSGRSVTIAWTAPPWTGSIAARRSARTQAQSSGNNGDRVGGGGTTGRFVSRSPNRSKATTSARGASICSSISSRRPASRDTSLAPIGYGSVPLPAW